MANWIGASALHQTRIFSEVVSDKPKPVAYFLVDAMRFDMGVELAERLPTTAEVAVRPAIGVRPLLTGKQVGAAGMAIDAKLDRSTGCVKLQLGKPVTVAFLLSDESVPCTAHPAR